jgi:adenine-specific DNA-methyltransferase
MAIRRAKNKLGQYFTPQEICNFMIQLAGVKLDSKVLEPSSGQGAFLDALETQGFTDVSGVELDPELARHSKFPVHSSSFIVWESGDKYDLVIGNPPYIRWKDLEIDQKDELRKHRLFGTIVNSLSDYLLPFIALSIEKLNSGGVLVFITPSFWLQTKHSSSLRDYLAAHGQITDVVDFGETKIFKNVSTSLVVFRFVKTQIKQPITLHRFALKKLPEKLRLKDPMQFRVEKINHFESNGKFVSAFDDEVKTPLLLQGECAATDEMFKSGEFNNLGKYIQIANGMVTGLDQAFKLDQDFYASLPVHEKEYVSKVLKGRDLVSLVSSNWTPYIDFPAGLRESEVQAGYPNLYSRLLPYKEALNARYSYDDSGEWWRWSFYRSESFHRSNTKKIFVPGKERITNKSLVRFSLSSSNAMATQDVTAFAPLGEVRESVEYIAAYLNRRAVTQWIRSFGLIKGGVAEFSEKPLSEIPFRSVNWSVQNEVETHRRITEVVKNFETGKISRADLEATLRIEFTHLLGEELSD